LRAIARGSLESVENGDIYCKVRSGIKGKLFATTVQWVIDNGTVVKKGDIVMTLDASPFRNQLKDKIKEVKQALSSKVKADQDIETQKLDNEANINKAINDLQVARKDLAKGTNDADLKARVAEAERVLKKTMVQAPLKLQLLETDKEVKNALYDLEVARQAEIEKQIENCTIKASKDGLVMYYVPPGTRANDDSQVVAQGKPVREAQKLLQIPDLKNMVVKVRIPEALVTHLHSEGKDKSKWQAALIKVDAIPNTVLKGHVKFVDPVGGSGTSFSPPPPGFATLVAIDNDKNPKMPRLLPGMSAEVTIEADRKTGVVRVPVQAVVHAGQRHYCYVKVGKEIEKRAVVLGLKSDLFVEIKTGIQEGEAVLSDVDGLLRRLNPLMGPPATPEQKKL
jgi:HlyD family secretion protein